MRQKTRGFRASGTEPAGTDLRFGCPPGIYAFAQNEMTSAEMLQSTYLRFIDEEATVKQALAQIRLGDWSMVKRVDLEGFSSQKLLAGFFSRQWNKM